jgi:diguanylate cyclase (GGDEF)-like protein
MKVLIADDSMISRRLLEAALHKWSYEVVVACDGAEAWEHLRTEGAPRIAILDWMMPGLSGPEVCRRVRQLAQDHYTYILLVTSRRLKEDLIEGMEAGADDYITKPFDQNELKVRLGPGRRIVELHDALLEAQKALREQATIDSLTGVWNRRMILDNLDAEIARTIRAGSTVGLVLMDLDRFKSVNDTYGHLAGDAVLRETAAKLRESSRTYDAVGRYGGEEFLIVLAGCDEGAARRQAERLRKEIETNEVLFDGQALRTTGSFGVTSLPAGCHVDGASLLRVADDALLEAKRRGRNTVVVVPLEEHPLGASIRDHTNC